MSAFSTEFRVRYEETDRAGVVYHANYLIYFEIGRTEWLRSFGQSYRSMEDEGMLLTVVEANVRYLRPARYDDLLRLDTRVVEVGGVRVAFAYELFHSEKNELLATGSTCLAALRADNGRPRRLPEELRQRLEQMRVTPDPARKI